MLRRVAVLYLLLICDPSQWAAVLYLLLICNPSQWAAVLYLLLICDPSQRGAETGRCTVHVFAFNLRPFSTGCCTLFAFNLRPVARGHCTVFAFSLRPVSTGRPMVADMMEVCKLRSYLWI